MERFSIQRLGVTGYHTVLLEHSHFILSISSLNGISQYMYGILPKKHSLKLKETHAIILHTTVLWKAATHRRMLKETESEYEENTAYGEKKIALPHPISTTLITICVWLLNALQAELCALCIVMSSGEECHRGAVLT